MIEKEEKSKRDNTGKGIASLRVHLGNRNVNGLKKVACREPDHFKAIPQGRNCGPDGKKNGKSWLNLQPSNAQPRKESKKASAWTKEKPKDQEIE